MLEERICAECHEQFEPRIPTHELCWKCFRILQVEEEAERLKLPELTGTDKQIRWALQIRSDFLHVFVNDLGYRKMVLTKLMSNLTLLGFPDDASPKRFSFPGLYDEQWRQTVKRILVGEGVTAGFWIANVDRSRQYDSSGKMASTMMKYLAKDIQAHTEETPFHDDVPF